MLRIKQIQKLNLYIMYRCLYLIFFPLSFRIYLSCQQPSYFTKVIILLRNISSNILMILNHLFYLILFLNEYLYLHILQYLLKIFLLYNIYAFHLSKYISLLIRNQLYKLYVYIYQLLLRNCRVLCLYAKNVYDEHILFFIISILQLIMLSILLYIYIYLL